MCTRHSVGDVKWEAGVLSLEFGKEVWAWAINLGAIDIYVMLKVIGSGKTTNRVNVDRRRSKTKLGNININRSGERRRTNKGKRDVASVTTWNLTTQSMVRGLSVSTLLGRETRLCSRPTESESHFNKILQVVCSRFTDEKNYPGTHEKKLHHGRRNFVKCANMSEKIRTKKWPLSLASWKLLVTSTRGVLLDYI